MLKGFMQGRREQFLKFIDKRIPAAREHTLIQRRLFILPNSQGFAFLLLIAILWVLGTNYQNNLVLALAFLMCSLFVVAILHTFLNLLGLRIEYKTYAEVFAQHEAKVVFSLVNKKTRWVESIVLFWHGEEASAELCNIEAAQTNDLSLYLYAPTRGVMALPRLCVQSDFPFGLLRCWTWLNWSDQILVYPAPLNSTIRPIHSVEGQSDGLHPVRGGEDFQGLQPYKVGDNFRHISWKVYARGQGLYVKDFAQSVSKENWLDFDAIHSSSIEQKLSILSFWVQHFYQQDEYFGLKMPACSYGPDSGYEHRKRCLKALAEF